jgi:RNA polymerase sigma-70 factor (ECF subfamily)
MGHSQTLSLTGVSVRNTSDLASKQDEIYVKAAQEFGPSMVRLTAAYEADPTHQEDLLQDIHMALWRSFATFANQCSLRTWVYRVAHNTAASHVRRKLRGRLLPSINLDDLNDIPHEFDAERHVDESEVLTRVHALIQQLKPIDRDVLLLYLEGMEGAEIAEIVGISRSNVAQKVCRAKNLLQRSFTFGDDHDPTK